MADEKPGDTALTVTHPYLLELHVVREGEKVFRINATIGFGVGPRGIPTQTTFSSLETDEDVAKTAGTLVAFAEQAAYNACSVTKK